MKLNMRDAFCSSGNRLQSCWPLTWIGPVLGAGTGLGATTKATVPVPFPDDPEVIEIQGAALSADHTQLVADAIEIDPAPLVPGVSEAFDRTCGLPPLWRNDRGPTVLKPTPTFEMRTVPAVPPPERQGPTTCTLDRWSG